MSAFGFDKSDWLPDFLCSKDTFGIDEINKWLKDNLDKDGLQENYLDGHGYQKHDNKTVFRSKDKKYFVFELHEDKYGREYYTVIHAGNFILWIDASKYDSKMKARF